MRKNLMKPTIAWSSIVSGMRICQEILKTATWQIKSKLPLVIVGFLEDKFVVIVVMEYPVFVNSIRKDIQVEK